MQQNNYFSGKLRLLNRTLKQWTKLHKTGEFAGLKKQKQQVFIHRIQKLQRQLTAWSTNDYVKPALVSASLALGMVVANPVQAQSFNTPVENAFNVVFPQSGITLPAFADMDNDGDLDFFSNNYQDGVIYFENIGDATNPNYGPVQESVFGLPTTGLIISTVGDLDGDGDNDFLYSGVYNYYGEGLSYMTNVGTADFPLFTPALTEVNPFNISFDIPAGLFIPELVDLDQDGDLDLMVAVYYDEIELNYFENIGTPTAPNFAAAQINPFGLNIPEIEFLSFGDIDADGDIDMLSGFYGEIKFYENTGDGTIQFEQPVINPFGIMPIEDRPHIPELLDIDGDGDLDIVAGSYDYDTEKPNITFFENIGESLPFAANGTIDILEDNSYAFAAEDFNFQDNDGDPLSTITIESLPNNGTLSLNGTPVTIGQTIAAADIGTLMFVPVMDAFGVGYATFTFSASDGENQTNTYTMTINVESVNDSPAFTLAMESDSVCIGTTSYALELSGINAGGGETQDLIITTSNEGSLISDVLVDYENPNETATINLTLADLPEAALDVFTISMTDGIETVAQNFSLATTICETSLEQIDLTNLSLTPNPANNQVRLNINALANKEAVEVNIYNMVGQLILQKDNIFNGANLDISTLPTGTYLVKVKTNDKTFVQKLLVNNK